MRSSRMRRSACAFARAFLNTNVSVNLSIYALVNAKKNQLMLFRLLFMLLYRSNWSSLRLPGQFSKSYWNPCFVFSIRKFIVVLLSVAVCNSSFDFGGFRIVFCVFIIFFFFFCVSVQENACN